MKKSILFAMLFCAAVTAVTAHAGDYSDEYLKEKVCTLVATVGQNSYMKKQSGAPKLDHSVDDAWAAMARWAINYGYNKATDPKDAYIASYAMCRDNIRESYIRAGEGHGFLQDSDIR
jgi:hypothetical protein